MKRSINRWTTTVAMAAVLGLPVVGFANTLQDPAPQQQPQPTQPESAPPQAEPARPQPTEQQAQPAQPQPPQPASPSATPAPTEQTVPPQEHLRQAKAAADSITTASVPAKSRAKLAQLKRHLSELEKASSEPAAQSATAPQPAGAKDNWGKDVAAIDKIITEMVGDQTTGAVTPGASTPGATGTSGSSKADDAVAVDEATRAKLMEVRTHITAFAAGMAGSGAPKTDATPAPSTSPVSQEQPSSAAASPGQSPAPTAAEPAPPAAPAAQQPGAATQEPGAAAQEAGAQAQIDADAARRHLMAARESLSQITQLPAAGQLAGEARTQVAQLISNFNELITTQSNWRASYAKVDANLTALIGPENGDAEAAGGAAATTPAPGAQAPGAPTPGAEPPTAQAPAGTPGSVGTSGSATVEIDPAIRAKLVELRQHLAQFEKASGGTK
jgi:hypothetical protein